MSDSIDRLRATSSENTPLHFVMIGDVGGFDTYHVGDEAMLEANLDGVRHLCPNATFTVLSHDPVWTSQHYNVRSLPMIGFSNLPGENQVRRARLAELLANAEMSLSEQPLASNSLGKEIITTLRNADGLIISGGGNMNSTWPGYLFERAALIRMAHMFRKATIVLGQTIGPHLSTPERELLADVFPRANLIGVREKNSVALVQRLGVTVDKIQYQLDDAFFLKPLPVTQAYRLKELTHAKRPWIVVTVNPFLKIEDATRSLRLLAEQLDSIARSLDAHLVFVPHVKAPDDPDLSDVVFQHRLASLLNPATSRTVLDIWLAREVRWVTGQAALVISTRYHPLVFALSAGVPCLGLYTDEYTRIKLQGALTHAGLEDWSLPMDLALVGLLEPSALELWRRRGEIRQYLALSSTTWQQSHQSLWSKISAALDLASENTLSFKSDTESGDKAARHSRIPGDVAAESSKPDDSWVRIARAFESHRQSHKGVLQARDEELASVKYILQARDEELTSVKAVLRTRDEELASIKQILQAREEELASVKAALQSRTHK